MKLLPGLDPTDYVSSLPGVSHTVLLNEDGTFSGGAFKMANYPDAWREGLVNFVKSVEDAIHAEARTLSESNETEFYPVSNWLYTGGKWGVCVSRVRNKNDSTRIVAAFFLLAHADIGAIFAGMVASDWSSV